MLFVELDIDIRKRVAYRHTAEMLELARVRRPLHGPKGRRHALVACVAAAIVEPR